MIKAEIVGDSLSPQGNRLISVLCTFPRIILSEINTHRMLSKNTSSSRAIPFNKMVEAIETNPFIPIAWQKDHKGMQGNDYFQSETGENVHKLVEGWLDARNSAVQIATGLNNSNVTKQLANRLLEPFMWTTMLITGSKEGWDNFFSLRLSEYHFFDKKYRSKKDAIKDGIFDYQDYSWLYANKGQAEIHMMELSEKIYDCIQESVPIQLKENEWHIPMITDLESSKLSIDDQIKLSVGRAANTSYTVVGDGKELTLEQAVKIHDKCRELNHSSVFEHCARAMSDEEYNSFYKGYVPMNGSRDEEKSILGWCRNFKGFIPYRHIIESL